MVTFGERLKKIRNDKNITLDKMAEDLQTTKATLSRYENNLREPKADFIKRIADYLGISVDYLLGKSNVKDTTIDEKALKLTEIIIEEFDKEGISLENIDPELLRKAINVYYFIKNQKE